MKIEVKGKVVYDWPQKGNSVQVIESNKFGTVIRKTKSGQFLVRLEPDYKIEAFYEEQLKLPDVTDSVRDILQVKGIEREIGRKISQRELDQRTFTARCLNGIEHTYIIRAVSFPWGVMPTVDVHSIMSIRNNPSCRYKSQAHNFLNKEMKFTFSKSRQRYDEELIPIDLSTFDECSQDQENEDQEEI